MADHVLVTGGAGYIGAHACKALKRAGFVPVAFDNLSTGWEGAVKFGPLARGDHQMWSIEAIAGRIDPGETPQDAARREAEEEAGLTLGGLLEVAQYYPSPGAISEYLYSYVALTDLPEGSAGVFGLAEEAENIRGHLITFDRLMELVASGEVSNAPLILTALWLARERPQLRGRTPFEAP